MKSLSYSLTAENFETRVHDIKTINPNLICVFFASKYASIQKILEKITDNFSDVCVIGCSTAGEIEDNKLVENSVSVVAINFEKTEFKVSNQLISEGVNAYDAAHNIGKELKQGELKGIFVLSPGLVNGSDITKGLYDTVSPDVKIFGGLAGDGADFKETFTFLNGDLKNDNLVAIGLYGDNVKIGTGSKGGWSPFGPSRRVTKATDNILYELDGKPALDLYKEYLQEKAADLPGSGLLYPFAILNEDHNQKGLIRTILDVNHEDKSLTLAGDIFENSLVCLMHADVDDLIDGAEEAASEANLETDDESVAFLVSCVGRKLVLADDVEEELSAVKKILGNHASITGFYSYGEISPFAGTNKAELHNQTMTVAHITEI